MDGTPEELQALVRRSDAALRSGNTNQAVTLMQSAVKAAPTQPRLRAWLAQALERAGKTASAIEQMARAVGLDQRLEADCAKMISRALRAGHKNAVRKGVEAAGLRGELRRRLVGLARGAVIAREPTTELADAILAGDFALASNVVGQLDAQTAATPRIANLIAVLELQGGETEAAVDRLNHALEQDPGSIDIRSNLGFALLLLGQVDASANLLEQLHSEVPENLDVATNLASARFRQDRPVEALELADLVLSSTPGDNTARQIKAQSHWAQGQTEQSLEVLRELERDMGSAFPHALVTCQAILTVDGIRAAIEYLGSWSRILLPARLQRAILLAQVGELEEAASEYRDILSSSPEEAEAFYLLALQGSLEPDDPLVDYMATHAAQGTMSDNALAHVHYGLGKAQMDAGETVEAFASFEQANAAQRKMRRNNPADLSIYLESIRTAWTPEQFAAASTLGQTGQAPIFILGIQRSGSTLTEQVLSSHPHVTGLGEQSLFYYGLRDSQELSVEEFGARAAKLSIALRASYSTPRAIDKFLGNFRQLGAIAAAFPDAIIVNPRRDPRSIALSVFQNRFDPNTFPWTMSLEDIATYYIMYERHLDHWRSLFGDRIIDLSYEGLVGDPEATIRWLLAECDLEWDEACLRPEENPRPVDTLSIGQVRRPIHGGSKERWRVFERELEPFTRRIEEAGLLPE